MKETTQENSMQGHGIEKIREKIGALAQELKKLAENSSEMECSQNDCSKWMSIKHKLENAGKISSNVAKSISEGIRQHPRKSGAALFGLGFAIAALVFKKSKNDFKE